MTEFVYFLRRNKSFFSLSEEENVQRSNNVDTSVSSFEKIFKLAINAGLSREVCARDIREKTSLRLQIYANC